MPWVRRFLLLAMLTKTNFSTLHPLREPCILYVLLFHLLLLTPLNMLRVVHFYVSRTTLTFCTSLRLLFFIFWWNYLAFIILISRIAIRSLWILWITGLAHKISAWMRDGMSTWFSLTSFIDFNFFLNLIILQLIPNIYLYYTIFMEKIVLSKLNLYFFFHSPNFNCLIITTRNKQVWLILVPIHLTDNVCVSQ